MVSSLNFLILTEKILIKVTFSANTKFFHNIYCLQSLNSTYYNFETGMLILQSLHHLTAPHCVKILFKQASKNQTYTIKTYYVHAKIFN